MPGDARTVRAGRVAAVLVVGLLLAALAGWAAVRRAGGSIGYDTATSGRLLGTLADRAALSPSGDLSRTPADGTTPDTATRDFRVPALGSSRDALFRACGAEGLGAPSDAERRMTPDIVCAGQWLGRSASVHWSGTCHGACLATLEVRVS